MIRFALVSLTLSAAALSQANLIQNGSFEMGDFVGGSSNEMLLNPGASALPFWNVVGQPVVWLGPNNSNPGYAAASGERCLDLTGYHGGAPYGAVSQSFGTMVGTQYRLTLDIGAYQPSSQISCIKAIAGGQSFIFTLVPDSLQNWETQSWTFVATSTQTELLLLGFAGIDDIGLDNVRVEAVPEPMSLVVLAGGLGYLLRRRNQVL